MTQVILNSNISSENVTIYDKVRITDSIIENNSVIGDFSRINNSSLLGYNRVDRNTLVYYSVLDMYTYIGSNSVVMHSEIGKFCSISWGVTIGPGNHDYKKMSSHDFLYNDFYGLKPFDEKPVYDRFANKTCIGNDVWIGTGATILNGVKIGDGAVIGANTIVTKDVPPFAIFVGNPGRVVSYRFEKEQIDEILSIKWWDLPHDEIKKSFEIFKENDINNAIKKLKK